RLEAEEHVFEAELAPVLEHFLVPDQNVCTRLEVVLFLDLAFLQLVTDRESVLRMNERDIVHDEDVRLLDRRHVFSGRLSRRFAVAAAVESPGAAERTVPRTSTSEFDRCARIQHADKVLVPPPAHVALAKI